jgi:hypothetical protein
MRMKKKPEKLSATLAKLLASRGWTSRLREYRVVGKWERIVGDVIALHARPAALRGKKLTVAVDSPAWMQQLTLLKPELLEKLNRNLGAGAVEGIVLKIGEVTGSPKNEGKRGGTPAAVLDEPALRAIDGYLGDVQDAAIKETLRRVIAKDMARKKGRS